MRISDNYVKVILRNVLTCSHETRGEKWVNQSQINLANLPFDNDTNDGKQTIILKNVRLKHPKKVCLPHININSIRNKLDNLFEFTYGLVYFLAVSETKLDSSFPKVSLTYQGSGHPIEKIYRRRVEDFLLMEIVTSLLKC